MASLCLASLLGPVENETDAIELILAHFEAVEKKSSVPTSRMRRGNEVLTSLLLVDDERDCATALSWIFSIWAEGYFCMRDSKPKNVACPACLTQSLQIFPGDTSCLRN